MIMGTAGSQIIALALTPVITRQYSPQDFGILGVFLSVLSIVTPIAALTYPIAIVLPKSPDTANRLAWISLKVTFTLSLISLIFIILTENTIHIGDYSGLGGYIYYFPIVILFAGIAQVYEQILIREERFKEISRATIFQSLVVQGGKVVGGLLLPNAGTLIFLTTISEGVRAILFKISMRRSSVLKIPKLKNKYLYQTAIEYREFPKIRSLEALTNAISQSLPIFMLASFFGTASVGYYSLCRSVLSAPILLVGKSLGDVIYPKLAVARNNNSDISSIIVKSTFSLALIGIVPFSAIIIWGPNIFDLVFGDVWYSAGIYARWIAVWMFFAFINIPSVKSLPIINLQSFHLKTTTAMLISRIISLAIGYIFFKSDEISIMLFGLSGALINAYLIGYTIIHSKKYN